jgi:predicted dehydrogenase
MKNEELLNVIVIGAGMYVCGRGTEGYGTILPALYQGIKSGLVGKIKIAATNPTSLKDLQKKIKDLNKMFAIAPEIEGFPLGEADSNTYQKATEKGWKPDCAVISVPDQIHTEITSYFLNKRIHCLVVKPLAPSVEEVKKLMELQTKNKVYGAVEFHKRFDRSNLKLKDVIQQRLIGDLLYFLVQYSQRKSIPLDKFKKWVNKTNVFQYLGIHYIDIIYFATHAMPVRVMAIGQKNFLADRGIDTYDSVQCVIEWKAATGKLFTSTILTNWIDPENTSAMSDQKIKVIGTNGRYETNQKERGIYLVTDEKGIEEINPDFSAFYGIPGKDDFSFQGYGVQSVHQFLEDVKGIISKDLKVEKLEGIRPTFSESLVPTVILEAANQSLAKEGAWVKINFDNFGDRV